MHLDPLRIMRQTGCLRVIDKLRDRPIPNALDGLVDHVHWHDEPLSRIHRFAETILDREVELHGAEQPMEDVLHLGSVDVVQSVLGYDLDRGEQLCRLVLGVGDACLDFAARDADLVDQDAVLRNKRVLG